MGKVVDPNAKEDASTSEGDPVGAHWGGASSVPVTETEAPTVKCEAKSVLGVPMCTNTFGPDPGVKTKPSIVPKSL
jgi:hypothetical protein